MKLDFNDLLIVPADLSDITSRSTVDPFRKGFLPLITAPMDTVVSDKNARIFYQNNIKTCLPRGTFLQQGFKSFSISEMEHNYRYDRISSNGKYLIDVANGHMKSVLDITQKYKERYPMMKLMVGNVATPEAYKNLSEAGADYIRVGIGNGCFMDGSKVTTINGYKNIEDIEIDDRVLTHKNSFERVLNTKKISFDGELIEINNDIVCTPDHKFYVLNKKYLEIINDENVDNFCEWVSASELSKNSEYLLIEHNSIDKTSEND